ncbi:MAG TPA: hypothetical protein VGV87_01910 [Blastocatellia bacterium]|jgi:hypothetical protein|nr:hypothetical protein [Blastocatellia bacterium]
MRHLASSLVYGLIVVMFPQAGAPATVTLRATPQKFREFYAIDDARIPITIRKQLAKPARTAHRDGARWTIETDTLVRHSVPQRRLSFDDGLPVGGLRAIAITTDGAVWAGGNEGLVRYIDASNAWDRWQYFGGKRYLPSDEVTALVAGAEGSIWVQTSAGISHIEFRRFTLADKASYFERRIAERHKRYYLVADSEFSEPGSPATSHQYPSDNDGLWTAIYVAAQAFRYRVTGDSQALDSVRKSVDAMLRLEAITGRAGFPARSFRQKNEPRHNDGVWHFTADGEWEWKADTSSDEIVGHFFAYSVVYDLAADEDLKKRLRGAVSRIADHLIDHRYNLTDLHGGPTRWGRYDEAYFETDDGREERALRSLELLSHLKVAYHMTGNSRYDREYRKLIGEMNYHKNTTTYLKLREELNYSDEELAMLSYYPLFRYEKSPELLRVYREGLEQWWVNIQREDNPLWIFIYASCNPGKRVPLKAAERTLYRIPMDLVKWSVKNSHRRDVPLDTSPERHDRVQTSRLLPADERRVMKWNGNPFQLDDQAAGRGEDDGAFFLLPYWLGRYHGFLTGK